MKLYEKKIKRSCITHKQTKFLFPNEKKKATLRSIGARKNEEAEKRERKKKQTTTAAAAPAARHVFANGIV
jgi:hypothetical protein